MIAHWGIADQVQFDLSKDEVWPGFADASTLCSTFEINKPLW
jgi:hypothetical protein